MRFATHVANLTYEQIPDDVRTKAKLILRDAIGNEIAASAISEPAKRVVALVKEWGGAPQSTIIGHGMKVPTPHAALVNAMEVPAIEGRSFNLIDAPLLTATEYLSELQKLTKYPLRVSPSPILKFYLSDLAKWTVKMAVRHPDRSRVPSYSDWESRTQKAYFNCDRTRADLKWAPASDRKRMIDDGIGTALEPWLEAIR